MMKKDKKSIATLFKECFFVAFLFALSIFSGPSGANAVAKCTSFTAEPIDKFNVYLLTVTHIGADLNCADLKFRFGMGWPTGKIFLGSAAYSHTFASNVTATSHYSKPDGCIENCFKCGADYSVGFDEITNEINGENSEDGNGKYVFNVEVKNGFLAVCDKATEVMDAKELPSWNGPPGSPSDGGSITLPGGVDGGIIRPPGNSSGNATSSVIISSPIKWTTLVDLARAIADEAYKFAIPLSVMVLIVVGVQFMTAGGSEEKLKKAKRNLTFAIVGIMIIFLSLSLATVIKNFFLN